MSLFYQLDKEAEPFWSSYPSYSTLSNTNISDSFHEQDKQKSTQLQVLHNWFANLVRWLFYEEKFFILWKKFTVDGIAEIYIKGEDVDLIANIASQQWWTRQLLTSGSI